MQGKAGFYLRYILGFPSGYNASACISCTNGYQNITFDSLEVQLPAQCSGAWRADKGSAVIDYIKHPGLTQKIQMDKYMTLNTNSDPSGGVGKPNGKTCKMSAQNPCELRDSTCTRPYNGTYLKLTGSSQIAATVNITQGYAEDICLFCTFEQVVKGAATIPNVATLNATATIT